MIRITIDEETYCKTRFFSRLLFDNKKAFLARLDWWIANYNKYMAKVLLLKDFKWILLDKEKNEGYYSFSEQGYEICIDKDSSEDIWTVYLCNRFEEVLEEFDFVCESKAIEKANEFYRSFASLEPVEQVGINQTF